MGKASAPSSPPTTPLQPIPSPPTLSDSCHPQRRFSSFTPVPSNYQVQIVLLVSAHPFFPQKNPVWKSSPACGWHVGFNDSHVFIFIEVHRGDDCINSLNFYSFFILCVKLMDSERLRHGISIKNTTVLSSWRGYLRPHSRKPSITEWYPSGSSDLTVLYLRLRRDSLFVEMIFLCIALFTFTEITTEIMTMWHLLRSGEQDSRARASKGSSFCDSDTGLNGHIANLIIFWSMPLLFL